MGEVELTERKVVEMKMAHPTKRKWSPVGWH
jgi:hypothetical protein